MSKNSFREEVLRQIDKELKDPSEQEMITQKSRKNQKEINMKLDILRNLENIDLLGIIKWSIN